VFHLYVSVLFFTGARLEIWFYCMTVEPACRFCATAAEAAWEFYHSLARSLLRASSRLAIARRRSGRGPDRASARPIIASQKTAMHCGHASLVAQNRHAGSAPPVLSQIGSQSSASVVRLAEDFVNDVPYCG